MLAHFLVLVTYIVHVVRPSVLMTTVTIGHSFFEGYIFHELRVFVGFREFYIRENWLINPGLCARTYERTCVIGWA